MKWTEVSIVASEKDGELVSDILSSIVDTGLSELREQDRVTYKIYIPQDNSLGEKMARIKNTLRDLSLYGISIDGKDITFKTVAEEDWSEKWKDFYKPICIKDYITIKTPWIDYKKKREDEIIIDIEPGMAFGLGSHETTRLVAGLMEKYLNGKKSLLDFGCGTGVLAIIASLLGVENVYAVDNDILAIDALKENLLLNNISGGIEFFHKDSLREFPYKVDIIAANILAKVFRVLKGEFFPVLKPGGILILSGILVSEKEEIRNIFIEEGFIFEEDLTDGEWAGIVFKKPGNES